MYLRVVCAVMCMEDDCIKKYRALKVDRSCKKRTKEGMRRNLMKTNLRISLYLDITGFYCIPYTLLSLFVHYQSSLPYPESSFTITHVCYYPSLSLLLYHPPISVILFLPSYSCSLLPLTVYSVIAACYSSSYVILSEWTDCRVVGLFCYIEYMANSLVLSKLSVERTLPLHLAGCPPGTNIDSSIAL